MTYVSEEEDDEHLYNDETGTLIDWRKFGSILEKTNSQGIECIMIMKFDGCLLASAGNVSKDCKRIVPPLVKSVWKTCSDVGKKFVNAKGLEFMFFNCTNCRVAMSSLTQYEKYYLCIIAQKSINLGYLKVKTELICDQLSRPLLGDISDYEDQTDTKPDDDEKLQSNTNTDTNVAIDSNASNVANRNNRNDPDASEPYIDDDVSPQNSEGSSQSGDNDSAHGDIDVSETDTGDANDSEDNDNDDNESESDGGVGSME